MKTNMGTVDRSVRVLIALGLGALYLTGTLTGTVGIVALVMAVVFLGTSAVGTCPLYLPLGLSTRSE